MTTDAMAGARPGDDARRTAPEAEPEPQDAAEPAGFDELGVDARLVAVLAGRGITEPFPVQALTIPEALAGRDVCGKAKTGSGKTLAFGLPLVERTEPAEPQRPGGLVLVPTRELCGQVADELRPLAEAQGLRLVAVYGGVSMGRQIKALAKGGDIVVATPGRLIDLMERNRVSVADVRTLVLDEADQMVDMGFLPQVELILRAVESDHQTMLFSATLDGAVAHIIKRHLRDPIFREVESETVTVDEMEHRFLQVHHMDKVRVAAEICSSANRTLVFVRTKRAADRVAADLRDEGVDARSIHGDLNQRQRERSLQRFADGDIPALVATNVAARGLHVEGVDIVMHYDPPEDWKTYLHRSGRTARAGEGGLVVTLVMWNQTHEVRSLQREAQIFLKIVKMYSNDERLHDLASWMPPHDDELEALATAPARTRRRRGRRR